MLAWKTIAAMASAFAIAIIGGIIGYVLATEQTQADFITNVLLSFCAGLLASILFTWIIQRILAQQSTIELAEYQRITMSTNLYNHFHSLEMVEARCRVERLLDRLHGRDVTISQLYAEFFTNATSSDSEKDWVALSGLLRFYESMEELRRRDLLRKDVARRNYKFYFDWLMKHPTMKNLISYSREKQDGWLLFSTLLRLQREVFEDSQAPVS